MPVMRATNAPSTIGTWYVGVCESSRHDWPNPAPDFVRVAPVALSPPRLRPPVSGHVGSGSICELWPRADQGHGARTVAQATTIPRREQADPAGRRISRQGW